MSLARLISVLLLAAASAAMAQTPKAGARTQSPEQMLQAMESESDEAWMAAAVAAAEAHPLGSLANPIRVGGPEAPAAFLARLRCGSGAVPAIGPGAPAGAGGFGSVTLAYAVDCGAATPGRGLMHFDIYHQEHRETRVPPGFAAAR